MTRDAGGISPTRRSQLKRKLFPYKFAEVPYDVIREADVSDVESDGDDVEDDLAGPGSLPDDGNRRIEESSWTNAEASKYNIALRAVSRWKVDHINTTVRSPQCTGMTFDVSGVCEPCRKVGKLRSFTDAVRRVRMLHFASTGHYLIAYTESQ